MPHDVNDADTNGMSMIPTPAVGAGSADLRTDSDDPRKLRELLDRARERLHFYESFDRIVGENTRRTGELMLETVALREQAQRQQDATKAERAAHDAAVARDHRRNVGLLDALATDFADLTGRLASLETRLGEAKQALDNNAPSATGPVSRSTPSTTSPAKPRAVEPGPPVHESATPVAEHPVAALAPEPAPEAVSDAATVHTVADEPAARKAPSTPPYGGAIWDAPRPIDVIVHGVARAAFALSLQRYLRDLDDVISVDAREFAGGILRLQIEARRPLDASVLEAWSESGSLEVREALPQLLEIEITGNDAS